MENPEYEYNVLTVEEVNSQITSVIEELRSIVQLPEATTRILLSHFNWDKEKLINLMFVTDRPTTVYAEAGVINPDDTNPIKCDICFMTVLPTQVTAFGCNHKFCTKCCCMYISSNITSDFDNLSRILCPEIGCRSHINETVIVTLLNSDNLQLQRKYKALMVNSFVASSKCLRWCPGSNCEHVIKVESREARATTCICGHIFCFACGKDWHFPATCQMLTVFTTEPKNVIDTSVSPRALLNDVEECPNCHNMTFGRTANSRNIVRCHVCNFYTCCYNCKETLSGDNYPPKHNCKLLDVLNNCLETLDSHDRYLFCKRMYRVYEEMFMILNKDRLYTTLKQVIESKNHGKLGLNELNFLKNAAELLYNCRCTLKYSFIVFNYIPYNSHNQSVIFSKHLSSLVEGTEALYRSLFDATVATFLNNTIQGKVRSCTGRRNALLEHIVEGREKGWWD